MSTNDKFRIKFFVNNKMQESGKKVLLFSTV